MKQKTETALCESLMELLKRHPFPRITIQMISSLAGVNRQTFYYHFDNVYDLLGDAFEYDFMKKSRVEEGTDWDRYMGEFLRWMRDNRHIIRNLINNVGGSCLKESIHPIISKCMSGGYPSGSGGRDTGEHPEEVFIQRFITLGVTQYILEWAENNFKEPEAVMVGHMDLILRRMYGGYR